MTQKPTNERRLPRSTDVARSKQKEGLMYETKLSPLALEALKAVRALRLLPADTTDAQRRVLTKVFRQINLKEQALIALALEEDSKKSEVRRG
jgi:hypothetical protein